MLILLIACAGHNIHLTLRRKMVLLSITLLSVRPWYRPNTIAACSHDMPRRMHRFVWQTFLDADTEHGSTR